MSARFTKIFLSVAQIEVNGVEQHMMYFANAKCFPHGIDLTCACCGEAIKPGDSVWYSLALDKENYIHHSCIEPAIPPLDALMRE